MSSEGTRVCLLTGASGLLGAAFSRLYGHRYAMVAVHRSRPVSAPANVSWYVDPLDATARKPVTAPQFEAIAADLTVPDAISRVVDFALSRFGRVDVLINAAAVARYAPLVDAEADAARMFDLNALVPLRLAAELAKRFWRARPEENASMNRNIINVSSTSAAYVYSGYGQGGYAASKAALNMLTCHLAEEFSAFGVRVNAVAPESFPHRITTESVCDAIVRMAEGKMTGEVQMLEPEGERVLT
jgi:NAD(P)-dependent dehydrogenase (short-subunit alcohol dehydrogenase family)